MRLDKYVAQAMQITRSQARTMIARGGITVDGTVCKKADTALKGEEQVRAGETLLGKEEFVYIMLNKPEGVVSASTDKRDVTVVDLLQDAFPRRNLFPAGRLDKTSTGFVLLTDDGAFAHDILAPRKHVPKTYFVTIDTPVTQQMITAFEQGVTLADGQKMEPATLIPSSTDPYSATVVLRQGVYHQIKRMFGVLDAGVNALHRSAIGGLVLDESLAPGEWRKITEAERQQIIAAQAKG